MPTKAGWLVLVGSAVAALAGRMFGVAELFVLAGIGVALVGVGLALVHRRFRAPTVSRRLVPDRVTVGTIAHVEIDVVNSSRRSLPLCSVHDPVEHTIGATFAVGPLKAGEHAQAAYRAPTRDRGRLTVGPLRLDVTDPLGLARRKVAEHEATDFVVLPSPRRTPIGLASTDGKQPLHRLAAVAGPGTGPLDMATLRPYVIGDDLRRVHWPSSAHSDDLQVRLSEKDLQGHLTVLIDGRSELVNEAAFEQAVSTAAGLVADAATAGNRIRLIFTDGTDTSLVDARHNELRLLETLALVQRHKPHEVCWPVPPKRSSAVVVLGPDRAHHGASGVLANLGWTTVNAHV